MHGQDMGQRCTKVLTLDDGVDQAMLKRELGGLEPFGQLLADGIADNALPGEADERFGFGQDDIAVHGERRGDAAGGGIGDDRDVRQMRRRVALNGARGLRHLHERDQTLLHARAARSGEDDHRQMLGGGTLEQARDLLPHHTAHGPHEERGLHDADGALQARDGTLTGANALLKAGFPALGLKLVKVAREAERIGLLDGTVPLLERAGIEQVVDALVGGHAQVPAARGAHVMPSRQAGAVEGELAMLAGAPLAAHLVGLIGGAQHPAELRRIAQLREHAATGSCRACQERINA